MNTGEILTLAWMAIVIILATGGSLVCLMRLQARERADQANRAVRVFAAMHPEAERRYRQARP